MKSGITILIIAVFVLSTACPPVKPESEVDIPHRGGVKIVFDDPGYRTAQQPSGGYYPGNIIEVTAPGSWKVVSPFVRDEEGDDDSIYDVPYVLGASKTKITTHYGALATFATNAIQPAIENDVIDLKEKSEAKRDELDGETSESDSQSNESEETEQLKSKQHAVGIGPQGGNRKYADVRLPKARELTFRQIPEDIRMLPEDDKMRKRVESLSIYRDYTYYYIESGISVRKLYVHHSSTEDASLGMRLTLGQIVGELGYATKGEREFVIWEKEGVPLDFGEESVFVGYKPRHIDMTLIHPEAYLLMDETDWRRDDGGDDLWGGDLGYWSVCTDTPVADDAQQADEDQAGAGVGPGKGKNRFARVKAKGNYSFIEQPIRRSSRLEADLRIRVVPGDVSGSGNVQLYYGDEVNKTSYVLNFWEGSGTIDQEINGERLKQDEESKIYLNYDLGDGLLHRVRIRIEDSPRTADDFKESGRQLQVYFDKNEFPSVRMDLIGTPKFYKLCIGAGSPPWAASEYWQVDYDDVECRTIPNKLSMERKR